MFVLPNSHLLGVDDQAVVFQPPEQRSQISLVCLRILTCHQNVIQVHKHTLEAAAHCVHQALEGLSGVLETKRGAQKLVQAEGGHDCSLFDVFGGHRDLMVASDEVNLGEDDLAMEDG